MPTKHVFVRVASNARFHRVQMHIEDQPAEVHFILDEFRLVPALPQASCSSVADVESAAEQVLDPVHPSPQRYRRRANHQVVVIQHHTPRENRPTVSFFRLSDCLDERDRFFRIGEDWLATRDSVVHVKQTTRDLDPRLSNHRLFPFRESYHNFLSF